MKTDGFFCRDGWIRELSFEEGFSFEGILRGELVAESGETVGICFCGGSEECPYLRRTSYGEKPELAGLPRG